MTEIPPRAPIISEEYAKVNGMPHFRRTYADGTVEFEPRDFVSQLPILYLPEGVADWMDLT